MTLLMLWYVYQVLQQTVLAMSYIVVSCALMLHDFRFDKFHHVNLTSCVDPIEYNLLI
jgi:phosphatidylserine synthase